MDNSDQIVLQPQRVDFHIHSAASTRTKDSGNRELGTCTVDRVDDLLSSLAENGVNECAITDHDIFDHELYCALKAHEGEKALNKVFPGVEFSVEYKDENGSAAVIHIVAVFDDEDKEKIQGIAPAIADQSGKPKYDNENKDAFTSDGLESILREIGLDVVLIGHEKSAGRGGKRDVTSLGWEAAEQVILTEFVDALEIRNRHNELDIKRLIEMYPKNDVPFVIGSDCHDWGVYPLESRKFVGREDEVSFTTIKSLPTFRGLVMAITDHSRIRVGNGSFFGASERRLDEIQLEIDGKFYSIPLSPGLNAIIGDNSVGKSLLAHKLLGYRRLNDRSVQVGYESYCEREKFNILSSMSEADLREFDNQFSVRNLLQKLHSGDSTSCDTLDSHFENRVTVSVQSDALKSHFRRCFDALKSKIDFNEKSNALEGHAILLKSITASTSLSISRAITSKPYDSVDGLASSLKIEISHLKEIRRIHAQVLAEIGVQASEHLARSISELDSLLLLAKLYRGYLQVENIKIAALNGAAKIERDRLGKSKNDEEKAVDEYSEELVGAAGELAELVILGVMRTNAKIDSGVGALPAATTDVGKFKFVSEFVEADLGEFFCVSILASIFNQSAIKDIRKGIEGPTSLTWQAIADAISGSTPLATECLAYIVGKAESEITKRVRETRKVTNASLSINEAPSAGLFSRIYFDLLAEDESKPGIYMIDQPEDQISQMSIKEHVLIAFKKMASRRQVILITHNPQFVVNLDVDNVVALKKEQGEPIKVYSGALEYKCDEYEMLNVVADTVEGGADVVRKRLKRYGSKADSL